MVSVIYFFKKNVLIKLKQLQTFAWQCICANVAHTDWLTNINNPESYDFIFVFM